MNSGDLNQNNNRLQLQPYTAAQDEICGLSVGALLAVQPLFGALKLLANDIGKLF
jgi:hypothetical protein